MRLELGLNLNAGALVALTEKMRGRVCYGWGKKIAPHATPDEFLQLGKQHGSDCSNWVRWSMYHVSGGLVLLPDGSVNQHDALAALAAKAGAGPAPYSDCARKDGVLRLCGFPPAGGEAGHIWWVLDALTSECHGRNAHGDGVDRRAWDTPVLRKPSTWCYALTEPSGAGLTEPAGAALLGPQGLPIPAAGGGEHPAQSHIFVRSLPVEVLASGKVVHRLEGGAQVDTAGRAWLAARALPALLPLAVEDEGGVLKLTMNPGRES